MSSARDIRAVPGVCEVEIVETPGLDPAAPPSLLFEVPHGATRREHYESVRRRLTGDLPPDLEAFFFVNTDVGAPECARHTARIVAGVGPDPGTAPPAQRRAAGAAAGRRVLIVRSLLPRTFVDCNRAIDLDAAGFREAAVTPAVPDYVRSPRDVETLTGLYRAYRETAERAYDLVCGGGGTAVMLHTYAPRTVRVDAIDETVVERLRRAYAPGVYETWEARPDVDIISRATDGTLLAAPGLVDALVRHYAAAGIEATQNASYRLDPATTGYAHAARHPGRTLTVEINRARLADPFTPFEEMRIGERNVARMCAPLAAALLEQSPPAPSPPRGGVV